MDNSVLTSSQSPDGKIMSAPHIEENISKNPKISIIIPVYNAGEFLRPCLDTLVNQTFRDLEFVCVLDCPQDGSDTIVEEYAAKDNRFVVIRNERNLNIGEARNVGIRAAKGDYIGFADHDDIRELNMFEELYNASQNGKMDIVLSGENGEYAKQFPKSIQAEKCLISLYYRKLGPAPTRHLYSKRFLNTYGIVFVDNNVFSTEDLIFNSEVMSYAVNNNSSIGLLSHYFHTHVDTSKNSSGSYSYWKLEKVICSAHKLYEIAKNTPSLDDNIREGMLSAVSVYIFYSSFLREYRINRLFRTLNKFKELRNDKDICCHFKNASYKNLSLTPTKRLFLLWMKWVCR